ncbi:MAG: endonuclease/exonuclease/phosphatase family protein [Desulfobacter sp.]|nr:MAG: endonuclease/exonuclease/phosphatase family protein [Desulfobacter sp.]
MLIPAAPLVQSPVFFENAVIPDNFGIICWNIHKENLRTGFLDRILKWKSDFGLDLILLQEARFSDAIPSVGGFPYAAAANMRLPRHYSGVITAANADPRSTRFHMTLAKEPIIFTPKNALITIYRFKNKATLMVVNIHAINFRSLAWYQWELARLFDLLRAYRGAMIVAGDFNCWRRSREKILDHFIDLLGLVLARPEKQRHIKKFFGFHLDRIYYRGLAPQSVQALKCKDLSDHNPIIARFELEHSETTPQI